MEKFTLADTGCSTILGPGPKGINYCYWPNPGGGYETPALTTWDINTTQPAAQETPKEVLAAHDLLDGVEKWIGHDRKDVAAFMWRALAQYAEKMAEGLEGANDSHP